MVLRRTSRIIGAFQSFAHTEALGGVILLACASVALLWANSGSRSSASW